MRNKWLRELNICLSFCYLAHPFQCVYVFHDKVLVIIYCHVKLIFTVMSGFMLYRLGTSFIGYRFAIEYNSIHNWIKIY